MASEGQHPDELFGKPAPGDPKTPGSVRGSADMNPLSERDMSKLRQSMAWSSKQLLPFRKNHDEAIQSFAGSRYGDPGIRRTPLNLYRMAIDIWTRQLISQDPRCLVTTSSTELKVSAAELEIALNYLMGRIMFGEQMASVVKSAVFTMGAMKVGLSPRYLAEGSGLPYAGGQPYAEPVLFEDWLHDMNARHLDEWDWCANRYRVPYDVVMQNREFDATARKALQKGIHLGSEIDNARTHTEAQISAANSRIDHSEFVDHVELWDVFIPGSGLLVTMADQPGPRALLVREWEGPERGPFHVLSFSDVPGRVIGAAPAQHLFDLQELLTQLFNQLANQARRQKTVLIVDGPAAEDGTGDRVMNAHDGQVIRSSSADGVREVKQGGIDPSNFQFAVWLREMISYAGGNIDSMGGLAQQAGTLGQEQLLAQSSSQMIRDMQSRVLGFTQRVMTDLGWWMYTNPVDTYSLSKNIDGFGEVPFEYTPDKRLAQYFAYNINIAPYSMNLKTPQERLASIMQFTQGVLMPLAPQMAEFGMNFNLEKLVSLIAKYSDLPEITELIDSINNIEGPATQSRNQNPSKRTHSPPSTHRTYTRQNVSTGGTQNKRETDLMSSLMRASSKQ